MQVYPIKSRLLGHGILLDQEIIRAISKARLRPRNGDVLVVTSKLVAISEGRVAHSSDANVGPRARQLAREYRMSPGLTQLVLGEADHVYRGVKGAILTVKDGDAAANAGIDQKNAPPGTVVFWPEDPDRSARKLRRQLERHYKKRLGVIIVDSRVTPLRLGTIGLALSCAGFDPILDVRGRPDLYGRKTRITTLAVADGIADAAHLVMGESREKTPFALVREPAVVVDGRNRPRSRMLIPVDECLYMSNLKG